MTLARTIGKTCSYDVLQDILGSMRTGLESWCTFLEPTVLLWYWAVLSIFRIRRLGSAMTKKMNMKKVLLSSLLVSSIVLYSSIQDSWACERSEQANCSNDAPETVVQHIWTKRGWKRIEENYVVKSVSGESVFSIASKFWYKNTYPDKNGINREIHEFASGIVELNYEDVFEPLGVKGDIYSIVPCGARIRVSYWVCE